MNKDEFITFQKFNDRASAIELSEFLNQKNVENIIEDLNNSFDPSFSNNEINKEYRVKLNSNDFDKADKLLQKLSDNEIQSIDKNYYLFSFNDDELIEVISKRDEWNQLDFTLAKKLLKERGKEISNSDIEKLRVNRINELAKPEKKQIIGIVFGYAFAFLGGIIGIFIGRILATHKKTLPNGERVYAYSTSDRKHGERITIIGMLCIVIWIAIKTINLLKD